MEKSILKFFNRLLATGFFIGVLPGAHGTYGSLLAVLTLIYFPFLIKLNVIIPLIIISTVICYYEEKSSGIKDEGKVVIDEIIGVYITFFGINIDIVSIIIGFILFRLLDIFKPYLINKSQNLPYGIGVMADDILAGILSNIILNILFFIIQFF